MLTTRTIAGIATLAVVALVGAGCQQGTQTAATNTVPTTPVDTYTHTQTVPAVDMVPTVDDAEEVILGQYADVDIIQLTDGTWRMYFATEPEVEGNQLELYTATSENGLDWTQRTEPIMTLATFPDAVLLEDGQIRLSYQTNGGIGSALSSDGVTFTQESDLRIGAGQFTGDNAGSPSTIELPDGSFYMTFREATLSAYSETSINPSTTRIVEARSADGLTYEVGEVLVDGGSLPYDGYVDGNELFYYNGALRMRYWTSAGRENQEEAGQYEIVSNDDGATWGEPTLILPSRESRITGGDPVYQELNGTLYMYFTQHTKGIYRLELE